MGPAFWRKHELYAKIRAMPRLSSTSSLGDAIHNLPILAISVRTTRRCASTGRWRRPSPRSRRCTRRWTWSSRWPCGAGGALWAPATWRDGGGQERLRAQRYDPGHAGPAEKRVHRQSGARCCTGRTALQRANRWLHCSTGKDAVHAASMPSSATGRWQRWHWITPCLTYTAYRHHCWHQISRCRRLTWSGCMPPAAIPSCGRSATGRWQQLGTGAAPAATVGKRGEYRGRWPSPQQPRRPWCHACG